MIKYALRHINSGHLLGLATKCENDFVIHYLSHLGEDDVSWITDNKIIANMCALNRFAGNHPSSPINIYNINEIEIVELEIKIKSI